MLCRPLICVVITTALSYMIVRLVRRYALSHNVMDTPNHRSSHSIPTPRGGGLSIVVMSLMAVLLLIAFDCLAIRTGIALLFGGSAIALIGWLDDKYHLSLGLRLSVHMASAVCSVMMLGGLPSVRIGSVMFTSPIILSVLAAVGTVWATNLFNFMDGIDGIAGIQTACMGLGGGVLLMLSGEIGLSHCMFALGAASLGFLVLNWHPAKIFMGDVGSGFIGFYIATVAVASENAAAVPLLLWVMMMAVFVVDATGTLAWRTIEGYRWSEAHRNHVYQLAVRSGLSHDRVALIVGIADCVLIGISYLGLRRPDHAGIISVVILAAVSVVWGWLRHRLRAEVEHVELAALDGR